MVLIHIVSLCNMGRLTGYLDMIKRSRLLAPNLREMTLSLFTGNAHAGNHVGRFVHHAAARVGISGLHAHTCVAGFVGVGY